MKILIVDDSPDIVECLVDGLKLENLTVDGVTSAESALAQLKSTDEPYDFVLVDYLMPGKNGLWFVKNAGLSRTTTKIMLMTAFLNRDVINEMFRLGICGYIIKPFTPEDVMRNIQFHLSQKVA
jgi:DNA-binding response OmpR family regulator